MPITRFAPSPTGYLHLGHAYSAFHAQWAAGHGTFLLRIEDIDPVRCKPEFTQAIFEDLRWLGLDWPLPVRIQSQHLADYTTALEQLRAGGFVYPCFCTRREIEQEAGRSAHAPHTAEGGPIYPGTCRVLSQEERAARMAQHREMNWRLDSEKALRVAGPLFWHDKRKGRVACRPGIFGDVVLARKDVPTSYHLSVTVDDHLQGVTLVTRGDDLFDSTHIHRLLQALLGYETPEYDHHALMTDGEGRRYAKRDQSVTLRSLRAAGKNATDILSALFPGRVSVR